MTKEEILAMRPGRELNKAVAEVVMEHIVVEDKIFGEMERYIVNDGSSAYDNLQPYSEDLSVARLVVERMISLGHSDAISWENYGNGSYTQAEAICKVALLVILGKWNGKGGKPDDE
jgi:hypothetical protein